MKPALKVEVGDMVHIGPLSGKVTAVALVLDEDGTPMAVFDIGERRVLVDADAIITMG